MDRQAIPPPGASRQLAFHQLLVAARKKWLGDALSDVLSHIDPVVLKTQLAAYIPIDAQRILAAAGIRDEHVFPAPVVLEAGPMLVGYYRLLLGQPQKGFYGAGTGMGLFKSMEARGVINARQRDRIPDFCKAMSTSLAELVRQMSPTISARDVAELPLLTLGSQIQGSNNNSIGKQAIIDVFLSVREIVQPFVIAEDERTLTIKNAAGRTVLITLAADPDMRIQELFGEKRQNNVAIEIKGGADKSNAHNRAGEAEKSHQKAKGQGFRDFWTIIATKGLDVGKLRSESPTTNSWFDAAQVLGREGDDWEDFRRRLAGQVGIALAAASGAFVPSEHLSDKSAKAAEPSKPPYGGTPKPKRTT